MSARTVAHALFRHRRKTLAAIAVALACGGGWSLAHPPEWRAEATLLVDGGQADAARAAALLQSRDLQRPVVERYGGRLLPAAAPEARLDAFGRKLTVASDSGAGLVRLRLDAAEPAAAAEALAALIDAARGAQAPAGESPDQARASAARQQIAAWRRHTGLFDLAAERNALIGRRAQAESDATAAEAEAAALTDKLALYKDQLAKTPVTIELTNRSERSQVLEEARSKLFELDTKAQELLGKYQPSSPLVQAVETEKRAVEETMRRYDAPSEAQVENGANPVRQTLEQEALRASAALTAAKARARTLAAQKADVDRRLAALADGERELATLERNAAEAESRLTAARIAGIRVVETAQARNGSVGLAAWQVLAATLAAGIAAALLVVAVAQRWSATLAAAADVERRLGLPVLTTIPRED